MNLWLEKFKTEFENKFIVLYWIDWTWKSTACRKLSYYLNKNSVKSEFYDRIKSSWNNPHKTKSLSLENKYSSLSWQWKNIQSCYLDKWISFIRDRWFPDVIADLSYEWFSKADLNTKFDWLLRPHKSVLLTVNESERLKRVYMKDNDKITDNDLDSTRLMHFQDVLFSVLWNMDGFIHIDTTNMSKKDVIKKIINEYTLW